MLSDNYPGQRQAIARLVEKRRWERADTISLRMTSELTMTIAT